MEILEMYTYTPGDSVKRPLFTMPVAAGHPIPVDDHVESQIDLNELLIQRPTATFFVRVRGASMIEAGIHDGDILIVDSSLEASDGTIVIVSVDGELTVKTLRIKGKEVYLEAQNKQFLPLKIEPYMEFTIIGVVTSVIHRL